ncbi:FG-GAP-like repeat-containing protein [Microbulbifer sp. TRSA005]|uniref:FG-GAP-like repeat-containing protein n=1 Tax=Microbulbifer sp. TRSA005 TaxID=3243383 RepID=UPI00403A1A2E
MRLILAFLCLIIGGVFPVVTVASTGVMDKGYKIYSGDINKDGFNDLYFEYHRPIIMLHGEVITPVAMPELPSFVMYGALIGGGHNYTSPVATTLSDSAVNALELLAGNISLTGDFNGDGASDLLVLSSTPLILHANGNGLPSLAQSFPIGSNTSEVAVILSSANPNYVRIEDIDGDGRDDILVEGAIDASLLANSSGKFDSYGAPVVTGSPNMAGVTGGQFRVNESGAVTYSVPLAVATGTAGVAPEISLNYTSNGGNGLLGKGWSIGGLSGISRCRQTLSIDGSMAPIKWTESDRFCLDGQRLLKTSGSQYGAVGATYKTEMDSFAKVVSIGGSLGKPDYFKVERKDGSVSYYGNRGDAKLLAGGHTLVWALGRFEDSVGNPIEFHYEGDASSGHRIQEIRFAYGSGGYDAEIEFKYDGRPDYLKSYTAGYEFKTTKRLQKVVSKSNGSVIREYTLGYQPVLPFGSGQKYMDRTSLLSTLQECVGSSCLPAINFEWLQVSLKHNGSGHETIDFSPASSRFLVDYKYADINGDGKQDIVWIEGDADGDDTDTRVKYAISNGVKFTLQKFAGTRFNHKNNHGIYFTGTNVGKDFAIRVLDYNADGRQDLAIFNERGAYNYTGGKWHIFPSRYINGAWRLDSEGISTGLGDKDAIFADFNGDGLADYISAATDGKVKVRLLQPYGASVSSDHYYKFSSTEKTYPLNVSGATIGDPDKRVPDTLGDFNGDGSIDLLVATYSQRYGCVTTGTGGGNDPPRHEPFLPRQLLGGPDSCGVNQQWRFLGTYFDGYRVAVFDKQTESFNSLELLSSSNDSKTPIAVDINSDGLTDVAYVTGTDNLVIKLSTGNGFTSLGFFAGGEKANFADLNNDGYPDLVWPDFNTGYIKVRYFDQNSGTFVSNAINWKYIGKDKKDFPWFADTNGDGQVDYHKYDQSSGKVYTYIANDNYPEERNKPHNVIHRIDNGIGNITEVTFENMVNDGVYSRLEMSTSTTQKCVTHIEDLERLDARSSVNVNRETICYPVTVGNPASLYSALNGSWVLPSGSHTLGKDKPVLDILSPMFLVSKVESSAPAAGVNPGAVNRSATSSVSYHYHQMKLQAAGRGMLGFQKVSTTDNQTGVVTETTYRQDFPFIGMPLYTETRTSKGALLNRASNNWRLQGWGGSGTPSRPYKPYIYNAVEETYDLKDNGNSAGELLQTVSTTNSYDGYGNALTINVVTKDGASGQQFVKKTENVYGSTTWEKEKGRLSHTKVTSTRPGMPSHVRESAFTYYTSGAHKGLLKTEIIEPNKSEFKQVTSYEYDGFGNVSKKTLSASGETSRSARTVYDPSGRYVSESYNALGHLTEKVVSRNHFGSPLIVEGLNGLISYASYDAFGREGYSWNNAGADKKTLYERCTSGCPSGAKYRVTTSSSTGSWGREYFDALGRSMRTETQGLHNKVYADKEYDNLGRVKFVSEPYFSGDTRMWTETQYDLLGRPIRVIAPDNSDATITYAGLKTITTNDKGQPKTEVKNVAGELVEVIDAMNGRLTYEYDSQGNLHKAKSWGKTNASGSHIDEGDGLSYPIVVTINYDHLGRKENMDDPDKGAWSYEYTGYGELKKQTNANGHTVAFTYDKLGRKLTRMEKAGGSSLTSNVTWLYDTAQNGLGQLEMISDSVTGYQAVYQYDQLGRNHAQAVDFDGAGPQPAYVTTTLFDDYGRVERSYDALDSLLSTGQSGVRNYYNGNGYLYKVVDLATGDLIQEVKAQTARGQLKEQLLGNGATTSYSYEGSTGRLLNQTSTVLGTFGIQNITYQWDTLGNLSSRHNQSGSKNLRESFCYDSLNRLIKTHIGSSNYNCSSLSSANQDVRYNAIGNITYKAGVGSYVYGENGAGPHAVTTAGGVRYNYDANGNMTSDGFNGGRTIRYTTFDKASWIKKGNHTTEFLYGPSHSRYYRKDTNSSNGEVTETWYIGGIERIQKSSAPNEIEWKRQLGTAVYTVKTDLAYAVQSTDKLFLYKDHLGSMDLITDKAGNVKQEMSFDAWGQRRNTANWNALSLSALSNFDHSRTTRGYTGHEMLDEVGLIHMNGRIYDPRLGRFMQADPFIQAAADTQMYNRYSYVRNNPLNATDPSGYFFEKLLRPFKKVIRGFMRTIGQDASSFLGNIVSSFCGPYKAACQAVWSYDQARAFGADPKQARQVAAISGASAWAFQKAPQWAGANTLAKSTADQTIRVGANAYVNGTQFAKLIAIHGVIGGVQAELSGGKFGHGFASAGVVKAFAPVIGNVGNEAMQFASTVILGGTASKISGGKFSNGARTAAMQYVYNWASSGDEQEGQSSSRNSCASGVLICEMHKEPQGGHGGYDGRMKISSRYFGEDVRKSVRYDCLCEGDDKNIALFVGPGRNKDYGYGHNDRRSYDQQMQLKITPYTVKFSVDLNSDFDKWYYRPEFFEAYKNNYQKNMWKTNEY